MDRFFFDMFDGAQAVRDDFGDLYGSVDDAADLATGLLVDLARDTLPSDLSKDFGVIVRDEGDRDVFQAVLAFRGSYPPSDPALPTPIAGPAPKMTTSPDLVGQSRALRAASKELEQRNRLLLADLCEALGRTMENLRTTRAMLTR